MDIRAPLVMSLLLIAAMIGIDLWAWPLIADGAKLFTHWDFHGHPNGTMSKTVALAVGPAAATISTLLFALAPRWRAKGIANSAAAYVAGWLGTIVLFTLAHIAIVMVARGITLDIASNSAFIVALLLIVVGNLLGKTEPNAFVGIRTPWSRRSDYAWQKSNRAGGRMFVAVGLATLAALAVSDSFIAHTVMLVGIFAAAAIAAVLSYIHYRRDPERRGMP
jgi:uncharacterized membrane protein